MPPDSLDAAIDGDGAPDVYADADASSGFETGLRDAHADTLDGEADVRDTGIDAEACPLPTRPKVSSVTVGVIRWDAWFAGNTWETKLDPAPYRYRLPFYGTERSDGTVDILSDTQSVMDDEIALAADAGLSYFAFCYYHPQSFNGSDAYNYGWRRFLGNPCRADLKFAIILQGGHLGPNQSTAETWQEWPATVDSLVSLMAEPTYQTVVGGRPLLYFFNLTGLELSFGTAADIRRAVDALRTRAVDAGLGNPYIAGQVFHPSDGVAAIQDYGFDAIGAYSLPEWGAREQHPYADLAAANVAFWDGAEATGEHVIPLLNAGWDPRPRWDDPALGPNYQGPWYPEPTPSALAAHLQAALTWTSSRPTVVDAQTVLVYAWNEHDEGGWLTPTLATGDAQLAAVRSVLRP